MVPDKYCQSRQLFSILRKMSFWKHSRGAKLVKHYENMPIQIYRKFHLQKLKIFR